MQHAGNGSMWFRPGTAQDARDRFGDDGDALPGTGHLPDFCERVRTADPEAANDDYYTAPDDFPQVHDSVAVSLARALLWWAVGVGAAFAAFAVVLG